MVNKDNAEDRILKKFKRTNDSKKEHLATQNQIRIETWRQRRYCLQKTTLDGKSKETKRSSKDKGKYQQKRELHL